MSSAMIQLDTKSFSQKKKNQLDFQVLQSSVVAVGSMVCEVQ
uniref:Uncharacterized protein n=1 Tax=Anguilla anguilla TaxID=7936 RepID=A0A0E9XBA4_ANGAN